MTDKAFKAAIFGIKARLLEEISREQFIATYPKNSGYYKSEESYLRVIKIETLDKIIDNVMNMEDEIIND